VNRSNGKTHDGITKVLYGAAALLLLAGVAIAHLMQFARKQR
jgi:hypothetical protein